MNADYLYEFCVTAQAGTIAAAATRLGMSASSLSRHLAMLESTLCVKLIDRGASGAAGVRLTQDGRFVYGAACEMVSIGEVLKQRSCTY